jgi:spore germination cell wall hydrolase CwlJ-like protein
MQRFLLILSLLLTCSGVVQGCTSVRVVPPESLSFPLLQPVLSNTTVSSFSVTDDWKEIGCLTRNVYFEARGQGPKGMAAVAWVTINRLQTGLYGWDICSVVHEAARHRGTRTCAFTWYCSRKLVETPTNESSAWEQSLQIAIGVYYDHTAKNDPTRGATYFHTVACRPRSWKRMRLVKTVRIKAQVFFREKKAVPVYTLAAGG